TKPSGSIRATPTFSASTPNPISFFGAFPKHCENLTRFSISHRTTWTRSWPREVSHKPKAICHGQLRSLLHCTRTPMTPAPSKHKHKNNNQSPTHHPQPQQPHNNKTHQPTPYTLPTIPYAT